MRDKVRALIKRHVTHWGKDCKNLSRTIIKLEAKDIGCGKDVLDMIDKEVDAYFHPFEQGVLL